MKTRITLVFFFVHCFCFGQSWISVGADDFNKPSYGSAGPSAKKRMVVKNNHVYVFNAESVATFRLSVGKWTGDHWEHLDVDGTFGNPSSACDGTVDNNEAPYFFNYDVSDGNAIVKKWNGEAWITVGGSVESHTISHANISIGTDNMPYILYVDGAVKLKKFDGTNWILLNEATDLAPFSNITMALDNNNVPYIYYNYTSGCFVKKFNGTGWEEVGITDFSTAGSALCFDNNNMPYIYAGNAIRKFNGSSWEVVATSYQLDSSTSLQNMVFDSANTLYVALGQPAAASAKIKKLESGTWTTVRQNTSYGNSSIGFGDNTLYQFTLQVAGGTGSLPEVWKQVGSEWEKIQDVSFPVAYTGGQQTIDFSICNGYPMITYKSHSSPNNYRATVQWFNNGEWGIFGNPGFSEQEILSAKIKSAGDGKIYVAYNNKLSSTAGDTKITVKKLGTSSYWEAVGPVNFSLQAGLYFDFKIGHNYEPYVLYRSGRVQKFNGVEWEFVGGSAYNGDTAAELALDSNDVPYIAFVDPANSGRLGVKKYNGANWEYIDQPGLNAYNNIMLPKIIIDQNDNVYIAFIGVINQQLYIKKLVGTTWQSVGPEMVTTGFTTYCDLALDHNNVLYTFINEDIDIFRGEATVKKFNGSNWELVGEANFSSSSVIEGKIAFSTDNIPYVSYIATFGVYNSTLASYTKYFDADALGTNIPQTSYAKKLSAIPNPASSTFSIVGNDSVEYLEIYDLLGKKVLSESTKSKDIDISALQSGIYIVKVKSSQGSTSIKLIKN